MKPTSFIPILCFCLGLSHVSTPFAACRDILLKGSIDGDALWQDFSILASEPMEGRKTGTQGSEKARHYIAEQYKRLGLHSFTESEPYFLPFVYERAFGDTSGINIAGWLKGSEDPETFIVITAHYDHLGKQGGKIFYGADDNASGVAAMLAIARKLTHTGSKHSVIFLATDAEEKGLFGAKAFVNEPPVALEKIRFNLNLDMLAQGGRKKKLYVSGSRKYKQFSTLVEEVKNESGICLVRGHRAPRSGSAHSNWSNWRQASDHAPFGKKGIEFLFVGVSVHRYYHTPDDRVEKVSRDFYTGAVETSLMLFQKMDALPSLN